MALSALLHREDPVRATPYPTRLDRKPGEIVCARRVAWDRLTRKKVSLGNSGRHRRGQSSAAGDRQSAGHPVSVLLAACFQAVRLAMASACQAR